MRRKGSASHQKPTSALKVLADLVPAERREQIYATAAKFKNLPEDDEVLNVLELLGFITVALDNVPKELGRMLDRSRSGLTDEQRDGLRDDIEAMFKKSVDTPSYKDLRELVRQMQVVHGQVTREVQDLAEPIRRAGRPHKLIVFSTVSGLLLGLINALLMALILTDKVDLNPMVEPPKSPTEWKGGRISYQEIDDPALGRIGVVRVNGEIVAAREGEPTDRGNIFVRPLQD